MFAFWGALGNNSSHYFDQITGNFSEIEPTPLTFTIDRNFLASLGQSSNPQFFPYKNAFFDEVSHRLYAVQGYLWTNGSLPRDYEETKTAIKELGDELIENKSLSINPERGGIFLLTVVDFRNHIVMITCDYSGLMPLYYHLLPDGNLLYSTHIIPLSKIIKAPVDDVGVLHHAAFHHTIGKRTLFKGIARLNPGETLTYSIKNKKLSFTQATDYYSKLEPFKSDEEASDALWESYMNGVRPLAAISGKKGILLSGGFDTRLVVGGFNQFNNEIVAVTFGDEDNFEIKITKKVSEIIGAQQIIYPLSEDHNLSQELINKLIREAEFANFPYCYNGSEKIASVGGVTGSTGYGGESFLGGQAYILMGEKWSQKNRFTSALKRSMGLVSPFYDETEYPNNQELSNQIFRYYGKVLKRNNYLAIRWQNMLENSLIELSEDIKNEIGRYEKSNPQTSHQVLERFWIEHHVLKQFGRQELTMMANLPVILPTVFPSFLKICSNLDPARKVDHGIYINLVQRHLGELAKIPTANIPINLMNPQLILWISRAWRSKQDQKSMMEIMKKQGNTKIRRYGWSNFEVWLRQSNFFDTCLDFISPEIFSHDILKNRIDLIKRWEKRVYSGQDFLTMITISQLTK